MASRSWNRIELIGNLTRDVELRYTPSGTAVATIGLATNRTYITDGEKKEEVDFHKIIAWGKLAELCNQLLKKGAKVFMSGRLQYREWETQDGQKRRDAEIVLEDMILITPKSSEDISAGERFTPASEPTPATEDVTPEEVKGNESAEEPKVEESKNEEPEDKKPKEEAAPKVDENVDEDLPF